MLKYAAYIHHLIHHPAAPFLVPYETELTLFSGGLPAYRAKLVFFTHDSKWQFIFINAIPDHDDIEQMQQLGSVATRFTRGPRRDVQIWWVKVSPENRVGIRQLQFRAQRGMRLYDPFFVKADPDAIVRTAIEQSISHTSKLPRWVVERSLR